MRDQTLERIWESREAIAKRCGYDAHQLVRFLQKRREARKAEDGPDDATTPRPKTATPPQRG